jgi:hypothetical protein
MSGRLGNDEVLDLDVDEDWFGAHPGNLVPHTPKRPELVFIDDLGQVWPESPAPEPKPEPPQQANAHVADFHSFMIQCDTYRRINFLRSTPHTPNNIWEGYFEWCEKMKGAKNVD